MIQPRSFCGNCRINWEVLAQGRERSQPANGGDQLSQFWPSLPIPNMVQQFQGENFEMIFLVFPGIEWRCMVLCGIEVYK